MLGAGGPQRELGLLGLGVELKKMPAFDVKSMYAVDLLSKPEIQVFCVGVRAGVGGGGGGGGGGGMGGGGGGWRGRTSERLLPADVLCVCAY
jgi:hypothetical protein